MSESDDSDAEGGLGNVTRIVLRPPGHSGKAKRGHLCFDASYECGNLGRVDFISEYEYDLFIRPDTCNPRYRLWFNFVVDNVRTDQRVIFNIVNLCKVKTLFRDGMTPLVKTSSRPKWQRLPGKYVYYHKSPEHRNHYILSFAFAFDREEDVYQFAFSFPFSYSRCEAHLDLLDQKQLPFFKRDTICLSLQNRKVEVITITNVNAGNSNVGKKPKLVVIIARSHPGESPTSFIAQGLMDFLMSTHAMMSALRDHIIIKIIPMMNPDGVFLGNYRCSLMGYDLNRHWNQVSPWSHPTLHAVKNFLLELDASKTLDLDMVIDMHAHSSLMGAFIYGNSYDDVYRFERHILFPKLLAHNAEDFNVNHTMYNRDASKSGSARRHLCEILRSSVNVYTLEVSFLGYNQALSSHLVTYNEDGYFRLGRNIARTLFEYYKVTGVIPANILTQTVAAPAQEEKKTRKKSRSRSGSQPRTMKSSKGKAVQKSSSPVPAVPPAPALDPKIEEKAKERRKLSRASVSQEKAVVQLAQLTKERDDGSSDSSVEESDRDAVMAEPNRLRYEQNKLKRLANAHGDKKEDACVDASMNVTGGTDKSISLQDSQRSQRKTGTAKNQMRARTAAYKTFDFSELHTVQHVLVHRLSSRVKQKQSLKRSGEVAGRKVGGGGIIGRKFSLGRRADNSPTKGWHSEPESGGPCLTIIDFNTYVSHGLEDTTCLDKSWGKPYTVSSAKRSVQVASLQGEGTASSKTEKGANDGKGKRKARMRSRHYYFRRPAILMREALTDCSPYELSNDEDSSDSCCSTTSENAQRKVTFSSRSRRPRHLPPKYQQFRTPSPITHILLTI